MHVHVHCIVLGTKFQGNKQEKGTHHLLWMAT